MGLVSAIGILILIILVAIIVYFVVRAHYEPVKTGKEELIGAHGTAVTDIDDKKGKVFLKGEYWNAISNKRIAKGKRIIVIDVLEELILKVKEG